MTDIIFTRTTSIIYDPRLIKTVRSLSKKYSTVVLGWNREGLSTKTTNSYIVELKLFNLKAPYGKRSVIVKLPLFGMWILFKLFVYRPKVVHACDLDTILPCYIYKLIFRRKLVFDVFIRYAMANIPKKFSLLFSLVNLFEEILGKKADFLIADSEKLLSTIRRRPKHCAAIMNYAELCAIDSVKSRAEVLTIVYTGNITRNRGLERITAAIKDLNGVELVIAGRITDKEFSDQILRMPNVKYKGLLTPSDALALEANSDVMISLYDLRIPNYTIAGPHKTFEAMMFGIPLITNMMTDLIDQIGCGIVVEYDNLNQIKSAIITLRDDLELRRKLGMNGRKAAEQKCNWGKMEEELFNIYERLLK